VYTDGAPSMTGKYKGFITLPKIKNPAMIITHCFIHQEALVAKTLGEKMLKVLNDVIKIVNYIKSRPLKTRIFETICKEMGSDHIHLLLHIEVRWLSRGQVFNQVIELKEELELFFEKENLPVYKHLFPNENWCYILAYLAYIFKKLNDLNTSI